ncbi:MAG TPA: hypothetical protein VKB84_04005 [Candidatus Binataceae bacterium]|nr:hypothetical protein [Candidatus Binataceae bacterium]
MAQADSAGQHLPADATWPELREMAAACKACDLWGYATQTVFGEGAETPEIVLIGEQPGNQEDLQGHGRWRRSPSQESRSAAGLG